VFVRVLALCLFAALAAFSPAPADDALIIGVMNDQSGPYADLSGPGGVALARMAIEDFGGTYSASRSSFSSPTTRTRST
jgi:branched-chain amino acid transport system substrate-binding protein